MKVFHEKEALRSWRAALRSAGQTLALVPTMGALHRGHLSLIARAQQEADAVLVSIYVNPTQFNRANDLANYPRDPEGDRQLLEASGCDALFEPISLYRPGHASWVEVPSLAGTLCGRTRPGHFRGVATVVTKLFQIAQPEVALFGAKDLQQALLLTQMAADLDMPVRVLTAPTLREADGLAMSSRNRRLTPAQRLAAASIPRALAGAEATLRGGTTTAGTITDAVTRRLVDAGARIDYVSLVRPEDLLEIPPESPATPGLVLAIAAFFGATRLIDNVLLGSSGLDEALAEDP